MAYHWYATHSPSLLCCSYAPLLPPLPAGTPDPVQAAGAILVFLPGMAEIRRLERQLTGSQRLAAACGGRLWVLPLHGSLSGEQQRKVFDRPPAGHRKVRGCARRGVLLGAALWTPSFKLRSLKKLRKKEAIVVG